jgi:hypothetical protein
VRKQQGTRACAIANMGRSHMTAMSIGVINRCLSPLWYSVFAALPGAGAAVQDSFSSVIKYALDSGAAADTPDHEPL